MAFSRKATDRQRSEKKQLQPSKGKKKLQPVAKEKYRNRFEID